MQIDSINRTGPLPARHVVANGGVMIMAAVLFFIGTLVYSAGFFSAPVKLLVDLAIFGSVVTGLASIVRLGRGEDPAVTDHLQAGLLGTAVTLMVSAVSCPVL